MKTPRTSPAKKRPKIAWPQRGDVVITVLPSGATYATFVMARFGRPWVSIGGVPVKVRSVQA